MLKLSAVALLLAMSCGGAGSSCGGGGCGGCGDGTYQFPQEDPNRPDAIVQDEVVRVRATQDLLDFLKPQLPEVIRTSFAQGSGINVDQDGVIHIPIPDTDLGGFSAFLTGSAEIREAEALIWLDDLENKLDLRFEEPGGVRLTMDNLRLGVLVKVKGEIGFDFGLFELTSDAACPVTGDLGPLGPGPLEHAAEVSVDALIEPGVGPNPDYNLDIRASIDGVSIDELNIDVATDCSQPECQDNVVGEPRCLECEILCGGADLVADLVTGLINLIEPLLTNLLRPIIEDLLGDTLNDLNGNSAKIETQIALADLLPLDGLKAANPAGVLVAPTPGIFPVLDRGAGLGMEITVNGGAEGEIADCIGDLEPFVINKGPVPDLMGTDMMNRPYHIGATLASSYINQIFYALHRSGSLCLKIGSQDVRELTGGAFTLNASLLSLIASDISQLAEDTAPVIIELKPRTPGFVELGTGEVIGMDAEGNDVYDHLIKLSLQELGIAFHVLMHDRYVRIFEVTTDIFVGLNITVLPDNSLQIAVGELRIDNFEETFNEVLPNANFAEVLPTLLDIALGAFLNQALVFDVDITNTISDALNGAPIFMRVNEIFRDGIQQDYLSLTLTLTSSRTGNLSLAANTHAKVHEEPGLLERLQDPDQGRTDGRLEGRLRQMPTGRVRLQVGQGLVEDGALEYQLRVDRGLWRSFHKAQPNGTLVFKDPHLKMPGEHLIEVRARYKDDYQTLDPTPVELKALVDPFAPSLSARMAEQGVVARVQDSETKDGTTLQLEAKLDEGEWFEVSVQALAEAPEKAMAELPFAMLGSAQALQLRARDASGNVSAVATMKLGLRADDPGAQAPTGCACHETGSAHAHGTDGLLILGLLIIVFALWRLYAPLKK